MPRFTLLTAATAALLATPALAQTADFAAYDSNSDGQVSFTEYSKWATKDGLTTTAAAQRFIKMTNGQASLDESSFLIAMSSDPATYDQPIIQGATVSSTNTTVLDSQLPATHTVVSEPVISPPAVTLDNSEMSYQGESFESGAAAPMTEPVIEAPIVDPMITPEPDVEIGIEPDMEMDMKGEMDKDKSEGEDVSTDY